MDSEPPIVDPSPGQKPATGVADSQRANHASGSAGGAIEPADVHSPRSLHPLSLVFELGHLARANLIPILFAGASAASGGRVGFILGLTVFGLGILYSIIRFVTFRYRLTEQHLLVDQGLIFRKHRSVPLDRIQNIDSVQNVLHRLLGVAEVRIETASGNEPDATMRVIGLAEIERLRTGLAARHAADFVESDAAVSPASRQAGPHAHATLPTNAPQAKAQAIVPPRTTVLTISTRRLIAAGLLNNRGLIFIGILVGWLWQWPWAGDVEVGRDAQRSSQVRFITSIIEAWQLQGEAGLAAGGTLKMMLASIVLVLVVLVTLRLLSVGWYLLKFHGYELALRNNDLLIQCGLLTKVSATVPRGRVQVVSLHRNWLARQFALAAIRIETLGGSGTENEDASSTVGRRWFVPILAMDEVDDVLQAIRPGLALPGPDAQWHPVAPLTFRRMIRVPLVLCSLLLVAGVVLGFLTNWTWAKSLPLVAIGLGGLTLWWARKKARSRRYARTSWGFVYRSGIWNQKTSLGFWDRLQDVQMRQSPFDRRWRMASIRFDTAGAGVADHELLIEYLDADLACQHYRQACAEMRPLALASDHALLDSKPADQLSSL